MALIKCPECGKEISDRAKKCPNCGFPIKRKNVRTLKKKKKSKSIFIIFTLTILFFIVGGIGGKFFFDVNIGIQKLVENDKKTDIEPIAEETNVNNKEWKITYDGVEYIGKYTGEVKEDIPHGEGIFSFNKDDVNFLYEGSWENGSMSGNGHLDTDSFLMHFPEFDRIGNYSGVTINGIPEGQGVFSAINSEGVRYEYTGEFRNGLFNGQGSQIWEDEDGIKLIGNFVDGEFCPSIIEGLNSLGSTSPKFSIQSGSETEKIILDNLQYILGNGFDQNEVTSKINGNLSYAEYIKRPDDYIAQFVYWPGYTVTQVWVDPFFDTEYKMIEINAVDYDGHVIRAYGVDDGNGAILNDIVENMYVEFVGIPLGSSSYENVSGGNTNCVVLLICFLNY